MRGFVVTASSGRTTLLTIVGTDSSEGALDFRSYKLSTLCHGHGSDSILLMSSNQDEGVQRVFRAKAAAVETARDVELARLKKMARVERERLIKEELGIPEFEKALQANIGCSHVRTKAWGDKYGSGLR